MTKLNKKFLENAKRHIDKQIKENFKQIEENNLEELDFKFPDMDSLDDNDAIMISLRKKYRKLKRW